MQATLERKKPDMLCTMVFKVLSFIFHPLLFIDGFVSYRGLSV